MATRSDRDAHPALGARLGSICMMPGYRNCASALRIERMARC